MKYFLLFLVAAGSYIYYERSQACNDNDLAELVIEKSEELCVMPELLEQYNISTKQCASDFTLNIDICLVWYVCLGFIVFGGSIFNLPS